MASRKSHTDHLRNVALFSSCSTKDLEKIAKSGDEVTLPAGSVIVDQGQIGKEAYILLSGTATVRRNGKKVATLSAGNIVGELSLLDHGPRTATVIADTNCTALVITHRNLIGVIDAVPALAHKIMASMAARIREFDRASFG